MKKTNYHILGVMSGTSLDGIDLAEIYFSISDQETWSLEIGKTATIPYSLKWKDQLKAAISFTEKEMEELNIDYTKYLAQIISKFIKENELFGLDAVSSHGHTIWHQPNKGLTLQIGNLPIISELTNQLVVCDFRVQDVELGGQGAPLVPIGDKLLFSENNYCLNLGGFANLSTEINGNRIAYDICPVNIILNYLSEKLGASFDDKGDFAKSGKFSDELFEKLNALEFYNKLPPKSLGLEWVKKNIIPLLEISKLSTLDQLNSFSCHIAYQLSKQFKENSKVLVTGGGAYNNFLIQKIKSYKNVELIIPSNELIEYKEALIFGFLGVLKLREEVNCLATVTGAKNDHSSGKIFRI